MAYDGDTLRKYAFFMIMCNLAVAFIDYSGIFGEYNPIDFSFMEGTTAAHNSTLNNMASKMESSSSSLEYAIFVAIMIINGLSIVVKFILMVVGGLPLLLYGIGVPMELCLLLAAPVITFILYDLAKLLTRVG